MSGSRVSFIGDTMAVVVQGLMEVRTLIGQPPVVIGGLAVLSRLSSPYRATTDLDVVDRAREGPAHLEVLRAASGAKSVEPAAVTLPTKFGEVKVDVIEIRQIELDKPSDDAGDRLHAAAHAWAHDTATDLTIEVRLVGGGRIEVTTPVAEPGPLIAMKLQAVMNRGTAKQGTDLLDIVRLTFDPATRSAAVAQIEAVDASVARDILLHVGHWFVKERSTALERVHASGGRDLTIDDLDLVADLLSHAAARVPRR